MLGTKTPQKHLSDDQNKQAREQAKAWISDKLKEVRTSAQAKALIDFKPQLEGVREMRLAFSALIRLGFWPELIADAGFRDAVEQASHDLDVDGNLQDTLAGSNLEAVKGRIESHVTKLQQWMNEQSRDYGLPRQTRVLQQTIDRLDRVEGLLSATAEQ